MAMVMSTAEKEDDEESERFEGILVKLLKQFYAVLILYKRDFPVTIS